MTAVYQVIQHGYDSLSTRVRTNPHKCTQWRRRGGEWGGAACAPAVNPCAPADKSSSFRSVMPHQFFAFHSTILRTNYKGHIFGAWHDFESKLLKILRRRHSPRPFLWEETILSRYTRSMPFCRAWGASTPVLGHRLCCPLRSYGAPLVLQQEQTPGAATGCNTVAQTRLDVGRE